MNSDQQNNSDGRAKPVPRTQRARSDLAKKRLMDATMQIIAERGLERFTLEEVGELAGYNRAHPAKYFGNKEGLVAALLEKLFAPRLAPKEPGLQALISAVSSYFLATDDLQRRCILVIQGAALTSPAFQDRIKAANAAMAARFEGDLAAGIAAGAVLKSINVKTHAILITSGMRAAVAQWMLDPTSADLGALRADFINSIGWALGARGEAASPAP